MEVSSELISRLKGSLERIQDLQSSEVQSSPELSKVVNTDISLNKAMVKNYLTGLFESLGIGACSDYVKTESLNITNDVIADILKKKNLKFKTVNDTIHVGFSNDDFRGLKILTSFRIEGNWLSCHTCVVGQFFDDVVQTQMLTFLNDYNGKTRHSKVYFSKNKLYVERHDMIPTIWDISSLEDIISLDISVAVDFYKRNIDLIMEKSKPSVNDKLHGQREDVVEADS